MTGSVRLGRSFWTILSASAIDGLGDGALAAALPLLTVTFTRDPRIVSLVAALAYLPWLLFSLPAGAIIDRSDHGRVMWTSQLGQGLVVGALAIIVATGHANIPIIISASFLVGVGEVMFANASQSIIPRIVQTASLPRANGLLYIGQTVTQSFAGPPLGAVLFVAIAALPFGVDAATFGASAALIAMLPRRTVPLPAQPRVAMWVSIKEGLRWLRSNRLLRTLALMLGINNLAGTLGQATLVLFATQTLGLSPALFGVLFLGSAVGGVVGGLVVPRIVRRLGELRCLILAPTIISIAYMLGGLVTNGIELGATLAVGAFAITLWNVVTVSLRQRVVPARLLGRVNSVYRMIGWGLIPVGAILGGWVAAAWGLRAPLPVAGGLRALVLLIALPSLITGVRALQAEEMTPTASDSELPNDPPTR
jgi:MFS family permease